MQTLTLFMAPLAHSPPPQVCRTSLLSSALKTLAANKENALPIKLFEVSDAILLDTGRSVSACCVVPVCV